MFNWDSKTPGIAVLFAQMEDAGGMGGTGNLSVWRDEAERYFDHIVNGDGPAFLTKGAFCILSGLFFAYTTLKLVLFRRVVVL